MSIAVVMRPGSIGAGFGSVETSDGASPSAVSSSTNGSMPSQSRNVTSSAGAIRSKPAWFACTAAAIFDAPSVCDVSMATHCMIGSGPL